MPIWRMKVEDVTLDQLYEFMERGSIENAPQHIVDYLQLLEKIRGLIFKVDIYSNSQSVINYMKLTYGFSEYKAKKVYNETIQFFYVDNEVSKSAWKNLLAEKMERVINFALLTMKDVSDASKIVKMYLELANLRQVNEPDKEELPDNFFEKPITLLSPLGSVYGIYVLPSMFEITLS